MKVENFQATILLDSPVKQLFWEQNLADVIITAGFEVYNNQITMHYIFQEEKDEVNSVNKYKSFSNYNQAFLPLKLV